MLIRCSSRPAQLHETPSLACYSSIPVIIINRQILVALHCRFLAWWNGVHSCRNRRSDRNLCAIQDPVPLLLAVPIQAELKSRGKSKQTAQLQLFAACLFILLRGHLDKLRQIVIDVEYNGNEATIKAFLLRYIWR